MKYGYARVSTDHQNPALQLAALKKAGCKTIFKVVATDSALLPVGFSSVVERLLSYRRHGAYNNDRVMA